VRVTKPNKKQVRIEQENQQYGVAPTFPKPSFYRKFKFAAGLFGLALVGIAHLTIHFDNQDAINNYTPTINGVEQPQLAHCHRFLKNDPELIPYTIYDVWHQKNGVYYTTAYANYYFAENISITCEKDEEGHYTQLTYSEKPMSYF
jgi:hypothetical protein